jgi:hypothetical protein
MTLKEKFMKLIEIPFKDKGVYIDINKIEQCEKIADEFAIEFLNWYAMYGSWIKENLTSKELLEIYKKEKGL